jgi:hypothetical protein
LRVIVDNQLIQSRQLVNSDGPSSFSDGHETNLSQSVKS